METQRVDSTVAQLVASKALTRVVRMAVHWAVSKEHLMADYLAAHWADLKVCHWAEQRASLLAEKMVDPRVAKKELQRAASMVE